MGIIYTHYDVLDIRLILYSYFPLVLIICTREPIQSLRARLRASN